MDHTTQRPLSLTETRVQYRLMGIRFACPNGHPLHVKPELAGKRGICPECQAQFLIPVPQPAAAAVAGSQVSKPAQAAQPTANPNQPKAPTNKAPTSSPQPSSPQPKSPQPNNSATPTPTANPTPTAAATPNPTPASTAVVEWYVRPAAGGQFGPADDNLIKQWVAEGRVGVDAHLWRTGWSDWRRAADLGDVFPQLATAAAAMVGPIPTVPSSAQAPAGQLPGEVVPKVAPQRDVATVSARYQQRKRRARQSQFVAAIVLIVLALLLTGVLWYVIHITTQEQEPDPTAGGPPAAAAEEEPGDADEAGAEEGLEDEEEAGEE